MLLVFGLLINDLLLNHICHHNIIQYIKFEIPDEGAETNSDVFGGWMWGESGSECFLIDHNLNNLAE